MSFALPLIIAASLKAARAASTGPGPDPLAHELEPLSGVPCSLPEGGAEALHGSHDVVNVLIVCTKPEAAPRGGSGGVALLGTRSLTAAVDRLRRARRSREGRTLLHAILLKSLRVFKVIHVGRLWESAATGVNPAVCEWPQRLLGLLDIGTIARIVIHLRHHHVGIVVHSIGPVVH